MRKNYYRGSRAGTIANLIFLLRRLGLKFGVVSWTAFIKRQELLQGKTNEQDE